MRILLSAVLGLLVASQVEGQGYSNKPILVVDTGGHVGNIRKVLFVPNSRELITVSDDKTIRFWNIAEGECTRVLRPPIGSGEDGELNTAALTSDGSLLAVGGATKVSDRLFGIYLIEVSSGRMVRVLKGHLGPISSLAFSPDSKRLASGSTDQSVRIWDVASGSCDQILSGHGDMIDGIAFSPLGDRLVSASRDNTARLWSVGNGQLQGVFRRYPPEFYCPLYCVAWSKDGRTIATGGEDQTVCLWNPDGTLRRTYDNLGNAIWSVSFTPDLRSLLLTRGEPQTDPPIFDCTLLDLATGREVVRFSRHDDVVESGAISMDGRLAATAAVGGKGIYVWRIADAAAVSHLGGNGKPTWGAGWREDGQAIAWGTTVNDGQQPPLEQAFSLSALEFENVAEANFQTAQVVQGPLMLQQTERKTVTVIQNGAVISQLAVEGEFESVRGLALLANGTAAVGSGLGVYLFNAITGQQIRLLQGHDNSVNEITPSPDGRFLLTSSSDNTLRIWDPTRDGPLVSCFFANEDWIVWTPEGYFACSPGGEKLIGWHVNNGLEKMATFYPASQFRDAFYRPDVIKRVLEAGSVKRAMALADAARGKETVVTAVAEVLPPLVVITSPDKSKVESQEGAIDVRFLIKPVGKHPITAAKLLLDGRPYPGTEYFKRFDPPQTSEVRHAWSVKLEAGVHTLAVQAESAVSKAVSEAVEVLISKRGLVPVDPASPVAAMQKQASLYVLAIGISEYAKGLRLNYAAKDAKAIAKAYDEKSRPLFRNVEVKVVTDQQATRREIMQGLAWLRRQMTQNDVAVISFAGHGAKDTDGSLYLLPIDVDPDDLLTTGVPGDQIKRTLAGIPGKFILILDACHAGAVDGDRRRAGDSLTDDLVRDLVTDDYGVIVMCSAMGREFAMESPSVEHGFFTHALVEGLRGKADYNKDSLVHFTEIDNYVTDRVKELTQGKQHPVTAKPTSIRSFPLTKTH